MGSTISRYGLLLLSILLAFGCEKHEPYTWCKAYVKGVTYDSISGMPIAFLQVNESIGDAEGRYSVGFPSGICEDGIVANAPEPRIIKGYTGRYFIRHIVDDEVLIEDDTVQINLPAVRLSVVKLIFLDTSGVFNTCFDYYDFPNSKVAGVWSSTLSDTTRYIHVYPNRPTMVRWYTLPSVVTSGVASVPIMDQTSPWNYTMYGDTIVTAGVDDTLEVNCFY
jgi:hypothetical protein